MKILFCTSVLLRLSEKERRNFINSLSVKSACCKNCVKTMKTSVLLMSHTAPTAEKHENLCQKHSLKVNLLVLQHFSVNVCCIPDY